MKAMGMKATIKIEITDELGAQSPATRSIGLRDSLDVHKLAEILTVQ
jgi:hypothetical protein